MDLTLGIVQELSLSNEEQKKHLSSKILGVMNKLANWSSNMVR